MNSFFLPLQLLHLTLKVFYLSDSFSMFEAPEVQDARSETYSTYEQAGVLEALGFNPLFFDGPVYKVEEDTDDTNGLTGKTARSAVGSARKDVLKSSRAK